MTHTVPLFPIFLELYISFISTHQLYRFIKVSQMCTRPFMEKKKKEKKKISSSDALKFSLAEGLKDPQHIKSKIKTLICCKLL